MWITLRLLYIKFLVILLYDCLLIIKTAFQLFFVVVFVKRADMCVLVPLVGADKNVALSTPYKTVNDITGVPLIRNNFFLLID